MSNKKLKKDELLEYLKKHTPETVLHDFMKDKDRSLLSSDLKTITKLRGIGLNDEVINVLIQYSFLIGKGMNFLYLERYAKHWLYKEISTAEEAMKEAQTNHKNQKTLKEKLNQENEHKEIQAISDIKTIKDAMDAGLTNEQLGKFVRATLYEK